MKTKEIVKHTPGPWKLVWREPPVVENSGWVVKQDDDIQFPIAIVTQTIGGTKSPQEANARLIASAPELLEATKILCKGNNYLVQEYWDDLRKAIAKAERR